MDIVDLIIVAVGAVLTAIGYIYSKMKGSKKKAKIPAGYTEYIGICKKHVEKDGKFQEEFEIVKDDKTLKYKFPLQEDKEKLRAVDSIEKFYIKDDSPDVIMHETDFGGSSSGDKKGDLDPKTLKISYIFMGAGIVLIFIALFMVLF